MYILGVETSCDETAAAVIKMDKKTRRLFVLSNIVASQIDIHKKYGGVIPEVAAREHVISIIPVINQAIKEAKITSKKLKHSCHQRSWSNYLSYVWRGNCTSTFIRLEKASNRS